LIVITLMTALSSDLFRQASKYRASKYTTPPSEMKAATETGQTYNFQIAFEPMTAFRSKPEASLIGGFSPLSTG
jgi:hypothetical protein